MRNVYKCKDAEQQDAACWQAALVTYSETLSCILTNMFGVHLLDVTCSLSVQAAVWNGSGAAGICGSVATIVPTPATCPPEIAPV